MRGYPSYLGLCAALLSVLGLAARAGTPPAPQPTWKKVLMPWTSTTSSKPASTAANKSRPSQNGRPLWTPTAQSPTQAISNGTKKVAQGTWDAVTLKPLRTKLNTAPTPKYSNVRQEKKPGLMSSLFKPAEPQRPQTMKEWMSLERPKM